MPPKVLEVAGAPLELGEAMGRGLAGEIHAALDAHERLQQVYLPYHRTAEGRHRYEALLAIQRARYPEYVEELRGLARGSERSFEELFLVNMRGEYRELAPGPDATGCTTAALVMPSDAVIAHNEDALPAFRDRLAVVAARPSGKPAFTALVYPGFLCGNAFGCNDRGLCFAVDNVRPANVRDGVGRQFLARSLLEARTLGEAVERVTPDGRASGFSYVVGCTDPRAVVNVEVAPDRHRVREVAGWFVHVNHYHEMEGVEQTVSASSLRRYARSRQLLETVAPSPGEAWTILRDGGDPEYPICRTGCPPDELVTLLHGCFDLIARTLTVYDGDPRDAGTGRLVFAL